MRCVLDRVACLTVAVCAAALPLTPPTWAEDDFVASAALHEAGLRKFWQMQLPLVAGERITNCYLVDDHLYLATYDGFVYAMHAHTGVVRWARRITTAGYRIWRPCHAGERTVFVLPSSVRQYDRHFGDPIREIKLRFPAGSPAVSDGSHFFLGGVDLRLYCFQTDWDYEIWKFGTRGQIVGAPVLFGDRVAAGSDDGAVYSCRRTDKANGWIARTEGSITADLVADAEGVYVASRDQSVYLLAPENGLKRWRARLGGPLYEAPIVTSDMVYQYCPADGLCAIEKPAVIEGDRVRWKLAEGRSLATADKDTAYVLSNQESLLAVGIKSGSVLHTIPAPGFTMAMPSPYETVVFIASESGRVLCARPESTPGLKLEEIKAAQSLKRRGDVATTQPVTEVATSRPVDDVASPQSRRPGPPQGGKSKVTKEFGGAP
jgi:hypothetical protein